MCAGFRRGQSPGMTAEKVSQWMRTIVANLHVQ
jgi:hypothetical protein